MSDELRDLVASAALVRLEPDEQTQLDDELRRDPSLGDELARYRSVVGVLEAGVAREQPPAGLLDGVLARIEAERPAAAQASAPAAPPERRRWWSWRPRTFAPAFAAGFAAAAALVALAFVLVANGDLGPTTAEAEVLGKPEFVSVHGKATLHGSDGKDGLLVLELGDVPAPAPGEHYEVWVLRAEGEGEMEAVGVFVPEGADVKLELGLPGPGDYEAVDVSVEPDGGSPEHSGRSLAGGTFEPAQT